MSGWVRRIVTGSVVVGLVGAGLVQTSAQAVSPRPVTVHVAGGGYVRYPSGTAIHGRVTTPAWVHTGARVVAATAISCASRSLCVATDVKGDVLTTSRPSSGSVWVRRDVDGSFQITRVSCPSTRLCVAVDLAGNAIISTDPGAAHATWSVTNIDATATLNGISCVSSALCVAVDNVGKVLVSVDPAGGAGTWVPKAIDTGSTDGLNAVSCPSTRLCVTVDSEGRIFSTVDPTHGAGDWSKVTPAPTDTGYSVYVDVSCPSVALCAILTSGLGGLLTSRNPAGGVGGWHLHHLVVPEPYSPPFSASVSCPTTSLCLASRDSPPMSQSRNLLFAVSLDAAGRAHTVSTRNMLATAIDCISATRCIVIGSTNNDVWSSINPSGVWRVRLTEQAFPFKRKPTIVATDTTTASGSYSFTARPAVATRYTVTKLGPGPVRHSTTSTIYVVTGFTNNKLSRCHTKPTCQVTWNFTYRIPKQVQASETAKPWHFYLRVRRGGVHLRGPWRIDGAARIKESKVGADRYKGKITFTVDIGTGNYDFEVGVCRKQTESRTGFGFPGQDPCGHNTLPAKYFR
jgi:hypothetical protein